VTEGFFNKLLAKKNARMVSVLKTELRLWDRGAFPSWVGRRRVLAENPCVRQGPHAEL